MNNSVPAMFASAATPAQPPEPEDIYFLLLPEFSVMGFVSALEPLRVANRFGSNPGGNIYRWHILSIDGGPVTASNGMSINADDAFAAIGNASTVFVIAGFNPLEHYSAAIGAWLRGLERKRATLGAIDTGCFILAEAGVFDQGNKHGNKLENQPQKITLHWEAVSAFQERFPSLQVSQELFEIGDRRITCAGGTASIDMMLELIGRKHGHVLATTVSEQFVLSRIRNQSDHQRMQIAARYGIHNKKTIQVISVMEEHTEEPLSTDQLAASIGVTRRQLERLFCTYLKDTPSHFYLCLRLDQARQLLHQTEMTILAVSVACGFESPSYFSRAYRTRFGCSPKHDRSDTHIPRRT